MTADAPALTALAEREARALAEAKGFIYWPGGSEAPADWDGGPYLCRDGGTYHLRGFGWEHGYGAWTATANWDRIGYRRKGIEREPYRRNSAGVKDGAACYRTIAGRHWEWWAEDAAIFKAAGVRHRTAPGGAGTFIPPDDTDAAHRALAQGGSDAAEKGL